MPAESKPPQKCGVFWPVALLGNSFLATIAANDRNAYRIGGFPGLLGAGTDNKGSRRAIGFAAKSRTERNMNR